MTKAQEIQAAGEHREQLLTETQRLLEEIDTHLAGPEQRVAASTVGA